MEEIVIYEKPTCSKCRVAIQALDKSGVAYRKVRYHDTPLTKKKLKELIAKLKISPRELVRADDARDLKIDYKNLNDDEVIGLMVKYPDLMQRPILERGSTAIVGRLPERILEFIGPA
ncbi:MAG: ArsC/Spx/MgsR family protein [bacterium]|nr:ArsC/Spx/MgsR family protein [bacterium]MDO8742726.1 ArsC/Spx/MgsR family protein [bacterium]